MNKLEKRLGLENFVRETWEELFNSQLNKENIKDIKNVLSEIWLEHEKRYDLEYILKRDKEGKLNSHNTPLFYRSILNIKRGLKEKMDIDLRKERYRKKSYSNSAYGIALVLLSKLNIKLIKNENLKKILVERYGEARIERNLQKDYRDLAICEKKIARKLYNEGSFSPIIEVLSKDVIDNSAKRKNMDVKDYVDLLGSEETLLRVRYEKEGNFDSNLIGRFNSDVEKSIRKIEKIDNATKIIGKILYDTLEFSKKIKDGDNRISDNIRRLEENIRSYGSKIKNL